MAAADDLSIESDDRSIEVRNGISLSPVCDGDQAALVKFLNDRDIYKTTLRIPSPYSDEDADRFIERTLSAAAARGHAVHFAIRDDVGQLIGGCGFEGLAYGHRAEIGYWLAKPFWGRGVMTDVVRSASAFAVCQWKLVRITAHVMDFNKASARVLEKSGFQYEGFLRKHYQKDGKHIDSRLYALVT